MPNVSTVDDDRLFPPDPATRAVARAIHESVRNAPIVSPHGHVDAGLLARNDSLGDPASLLVSPDHYVTRLLHAQGTPLGQLLTGAPPREAWRQLCSNWNLFDATATGYWLSRELRDVLGVTETPSAANADQLYDDIAATIATPAMRPRALMESFGIEVLATTDDPCDDLAHHEALAADPTVGTRVIPTFRPDTYLDPDASGFADAVDRLLSGVRPSFSAYRDALAERRRYFIDHGATTADHGVLAPLALRLDDEIEALFESVRSSGASSGERAAFRAHMMYEMARMSVADGLVMSVHAGVLRNHHRPTLARFGADTGHDLPVPTSFVEGLRPILEDFGTAEGFHLVLFTVDESTWSRELAPLAGFYPSVFVGAPWWFLDAPDALARFRSVLTESAGFSRYSGFVDDTRALLSIPARHDMARRVDSAFLARLVVEGRLTEDRALEVARDTVSTQPRKVFKL